MRSPRFGVHPGPTREKISTVPAVPTVMRGEVRPESALSPDFISRWYDLFEALQQIREVGPLPGFGRERTTTLRKTAVVPHAKFVGIG